MLHVQTIVAQEDQTRYQGYSPEESHGDDGNGSGAVTQDFQVSSVSVVQY